MKLMLALWHQFHHFPLFKFHVTYRAASVDFKEHFLNNSLVNIFSTHICLTYIWCLTIKSKIPRNLTISSWSCRNLRILCYEMFKVGIPLARIVTTCQLKFFLNLFCKPRVISLQRNEISFYRVKSLIDPCRLAYLILLLVKLIECISIELKQ